MAFLRSQARYRAYIGGIGSGKTFAGAAAALVEAQPGTLGMMLAPTYPMLRDATLRTFRELAGDLVSNLNEGQMLLTMSNGAEILCRSADNPDRLRGPNLSWAWLDEAGYMAALIWRIVTGRLRKGGKAGRAWASTTPKGFNWVYEEFGPKAVEASGGRVELFTSRTADNPYLAAEFVQDLVAQYSGAFALQELEGAFVSPEGSVFRRVRDCIVEGAWPVEPYAGTFIIGVDWGQKHDYTVGTVMDAGSKRVVDKLRINRVDWAYQREQLKALNAKWKAEVIIAEANSIGQPNIEALAEDNISVHPFHTTQATKAKVIQALVMAIENKEIGLPDDQNMLNELETYEQEQTPLGLMKYSAPEGGFDDEVIALALAYWGCR